MTLMASESGQKINKSLLEALDEPLCRIYNLFIALQSSERLGGYRGLTHTGLLMDLCM